MTNTQPHHHERDTTTNATLTSTQRNSLAILVNRYGSEVGYRPRGVRGDTIQALVRLGFVDRKWHTVGRIETLRVTNAGLAAIAETEVTR